MVQVAWDGELETPILLFYTRTFFQLGAPSSLPAEMRQASDILLLSAAILGNISGNTSGQIGRVPDSSPWVGPGVGPKCHPFQALSLLNIRSGPFEGTHAGPLASAALIPSSDLYGSGGRRLLPAYPLSASTARRALRHRPARHRPPAPCRARSTLPGHRTPVRASRPASCNGPRR